MEVGRGLSYPVGLRSGDSHPQTKAGHQARRSLHARAPVSRLRAIVQEMGLRKEARYSTQSKPGRTGRTVLQAERAGSPRPALRSCFPEDSSRWDRFCTGWAHQYHVAAAGVLRSEVGHGDARD